LTTLVEYPVDYYERSIYYYYPYFYKTHLITYADEVDVSVLSSSNCLDSNCRYCDPNRRNVCSVCYTGYYLNGTSCSLSCSDGYVADNLRGRCFNLNSSNYITPEIVSNIAYSIGSCRNFCGKKAYDCSCKDSCKRKGTCCTDYDVVGCRGILANATNSSCSNNCDLCANSTINNNTNNTDNNTNTNNTANNNTNATGNNSTSQCFRCQTGFYLFGTECISSCPDGYTNDDINFICKKKDNCTVPNCDRCFSDSNSTCYQCQKGRFLHQGSCLDRCPDEHRADRINWVCLKNPIFAWYWVYPSRTSCRLHCGVVIQEDWDCSCSGDCVFFGNCCSDVDDYCPNIFFWRKNKNLKSTKRVSNNPKEKKINIKKMDKINKK